MKPVLGIDLMENIFSKVDQENKLRELDQQGFTAIPQLLTKPLCEKFIAHYGTDTLYRSTVEMQRQNFGEGEYKYFNYPLPEPLKELRSQSYGFLLPLARDWALKLKQDFNFPENHSKYLEHCHLLDQTRPTPLILKYAVGGYNRLHQDLYGDEVFPFQMIVMLSDPSKDFTGGELVLTEQRVRMQGRAHVLTLKQGDAAIIAVQTRPELGNRGHHRINMRHGVSTVTNGERYTLGIILHDAK